MEKLIMKRRSGKTTQLIKMSAESGDVIVCYCFIHARDIKCIAERMGLTIPDPILFAVFLEGRYDNKSTSGFLIDNLDFLLEKISRVPINAITMTP